MSLLIGGRYRQKLVQSLAAQGIDVFWTADDPALDPRLQGHVDLSVFVCGKQAVVADCLGKTDIVNYLTNREYTVRLSEEQGAVYPRDAGLCVCRTGKYMLYNPRTADPAVLEVLDGIPVTVSQGYTKCAAAVVDDHSIITADPGVSRAAKNAGMDVLDIHPGHIVLDGFDQGFIGGSSFKISDDTIAFTGTLDEHPDRERILCFLAEHGQGAVFLTEEPVFDIGGAIPV